MQQQGALRGYSCSHRSPPQHHPSLCPHLCKTPAWAGSLHLALHVPPAPAWLKPPCQKHVLGTSCFPQGPPHPPGSPCVGTGMGPCLSPCSVLQQQSVCGTLASKAFKFWIFKWRSLSSLRIFLPPRNKLRSWLTLKASVWFYSYRVFKICGKCGRWQQCWKMRFGRGESSSMEEGRKIKFLFMHHFWYEFKRA